MTELPGKRLSPNRSIPSGVAPHRILLTGFMGSGKSTVGRLLADRMGWNFLDLDTQMERTMGQRAQELFEAVGEAQFRAMETELWAAALQLSQTILAPGGAVIDKAENRSILARSTGSFVVFLDAPFEILMDRCLRQEEQEGATYRPLLHKTEVARARFMERRVFYAQHAQEVIDVARRSPEDIAQSIWRSVPGAE